MIIAAVALGTLTVNAQKIDAYYDYVPDSNVKTSLVWLDGYDNEVDVIYFEASKNNKDLLNLLNADFKSNEVNWTVRKTLIIQSLFGAKTYLNNPLSYIPKEIRIIQLKEKFIHVQVTYYGKNAYGAESEGTIIFIFLRDGKFKKIL